MKNTLFVFPGDMICTSDISSDLPPFADQRKKITMRLVHAETEVGKGAKVTKKKQEWWPGFFDLRVITEEKKVLVRKKKNKEDEDFLDYFGGMDLDQNMSTSSGGSNDATT